MTNKYIKALHSFSESCRGYRAWLLQNIILYCISKVLLSTFPHNCSLAEHSLFPGSLKIMRWIKKNSRNSRLKCNDLCSTSTATHKYKHTLWHTHTCTLIPISIRKIFLVDLFVSVCLYVCCRRVFTLFSNVSYLRSLPSSAESKKKTSQQKKNCIWNITSTVDERQPSPAAPSPPLTAQLLLRRCNFCLFSASSAESSFTPEQRRGHGRKAGFFLLSF